jgi:hypothetical protein
VLQFAKSSDRKPRHGEIINEGSVLKCDPILEAPLLDEPKFSVESYRTLVRGPDPKLDLLHSRVSLRPTEQEYGRGRMA